MGVIKHDAIVVTAFNDKSIEAARGEAVRLEMAVSEIVRSPMNGYSTFLIAPDGSKEFWADSDAGDRKRATWLEWAGRASLRGIFLDWVGVRYGSDCETGPYIVASNRTDDE